MEKYKSQNNKSLVKKGIIKNVVIVILLLALVGFFTVPQYLDKQYQEAYEIGLNDALVNLATQQTQTGNMLLVYNNSLQAFPLSTLCQIGSGVQG